MQQRYVSQPGYGQRTGQTASAPASTRPAWPSITGRKGAIEGSLRLIVVVTILGAIGGYLGWSFIRGDFGPGRYPRGPANHTGVVPYGWQPAVQRGSRRHREQDCDVRYALCDEDWGPPARGRR
jgi:hypothetical protein